MEKLRTSVLAALCALGSALPAGAQAPDLAPDTRPTIPAVEQTDFIVTPAPAPQPMLRYRLLPGLLDMEEGDAAPLYSKAVLLMAERSPEDRSAVHEALERPLDELGDAGALLSGSNVRYILRQVDAAALRERWTVEPPGRTDNLYDMLLPEIAHLRAIGRLVALRARVDIAGGRYEDAVAGMRGGYVLANRMSRGDTLISCLVGLAIRAMTDRELVHLINSDASPNLYWALAEMPSGYEGMREPVELEMYALFRLFPELRDPVGKLGTIEKWNEASQRLFDLMTGFQTDGKAMFTQAGALIALSPAAVRHMMHETGKTVEQVRAMPITIVVGTYLRDLVATRADRVVAIMQLPYPQAAPTLAEFERLIGAATPDPAEGMLNMLMPALLRAGQQGAQADRRTAALMCVEAIRMHAAEFGDLPERLADITVVPVPDDPMTAKPFEYFLEGDGAVLRQPDIARGESGRAGVNYRIRLRK